MDTIVVFDPAPGPSTSAMAADTSALYWYAPDSVVESGGTISAWNDKTSNGFNLGQLGSLSKPTYNASGYVEFTGSQVIGENTRLATEGVAGTLDGGGAAAVFVVAFLDASGQTASTEQTYTAWREDNNEDNNQRISINHVARTFSGTTGCVYIDGAGTVSAFNVASNSVDLAAGYTALNQVHLVQMTANQSTAAVDISDGVYSNSGTVTPANYPASSTGIRIGARSDTSTLSQGFIGRVYEVFATADASTGNVDAIRAELMAKYSL